MDYMVGIVTRNRYGGLDALLRSLEPGRHPLVVVDLSDREVFHSRKDACDVLFHNFRRTAVVFGKNALIRFFLSSSDADNLFIVEDDVKVIDNDVFDRYVEVSGRHGIPHMNFNSPNERAGEVVYMMNKDVKVTERVHGCFQFFTRRCLERVGTMDDRLCHNCWEHIEHTARIHATMGYRPSFWHFPDLADAHEYLKHQRIPSIIDTPAAVRENDKIRMFGMLGWRNFPLVDIRRLTIGSS